MAGSITETRAPDDDVSVDTSRPRFLQRIGFPQGLAPVRESIIVVAIVAPLLTRVYRLYNADWKIPWSYFGDGISTSAYAKSIIENGWYFYNPRLGAPFQADWRDFPLGGENLHWFALKIIGMVTGDFALAVNVYFVLTFFLIALVTHFVARYLQFSAPAAMVMAVAYAFLPFHSARNQAHLARSAYYAVPLAMLVLLWVVEYRRDFLVRDEHRMRWRRGRMAVAVAIAIIMGASDTQNAAFMVSIMAVLALAMAARDRDWRPLALLGILAVATFGSLVVNNSGFLISRVERGKNTSAANRALTDQDQYGLRTAELVLPAAGHRIQALRRVTARADRGKLLSSETPGTPIGAFGTIGLVWSIGAVLALGLGVRPRKDSTKFVAQLGAMNVVAILIGVIGGFAYLLAVAGFGMYRSWNRISIYIALASILATGVLVERLFSFVRSRLSARRALRLTVISVIVVVLSAVIVYDQITPRYLFVYEASEARYKIDEDFYHRVEAMVPKDVMLFQLPYQPYPESGYIAQMSDYQDMTAYLHTDHVRWNYGGMRGRPEGEWEINLSVYDPIGTLANLAAVGFHGVVLDRTGFKDRAVEFITAATPVVGAPKVVSSDDRLLYFDLTGLRARLDREIGPAAIDQSRRVVLGEALTWEGFSFPEPVCGGNRRWAVERTASIEFDNTSGAPMTIPVSTEFQANPAASRIAVRGPGVAKDVILNDGAAEFARDVTLPAGKSTLSFILVGPAVDGRGDSRPLQFSLVRQSFGPQFDSPALAWAKALVPAECASG